MGEKRRFSQTARMHTRRKMVVGLTLLVAISAGGVALLIASQRDDTRRQQDVGPGRLLVKGRTELSVCVDGAGGYVLADRDVALVSTAVDSALGSLDQAPREFGTPSVTSGCPPPLPLTGKRLYYNDLCCVFVSVVRDQRSVSPHLLFVYFVSDDAYSESFGEKSYATGTAESYCRGDTCSPMTASLYVRSSARGNLLADGVLEAVGLAPPRVEPEPTIDWAACAQGTPRPWCRTYESCKQAADSDLDCADLWKRLGGTPSP